MNDAQHMNPDQPQAVATGSAGTALRLAREAAGLHIGALAVSLKVPVKKLEALEADDLSQLPDAVFARALAAWVCRTLKIDPEPILQMLPQLRAPPLQVGSQAGSPRIDDHRGLAGIPGLSRLSKPVVYTTAALLLGAILVWLLPLLNLETPGSGAASDSGQIVSNVPITPSAPVEPAALPVPATPAPTPVSMVPEPVASAPLAKASAPVVAAVTPAASVAAAENRVPVNDATVVLTARGSSWVQVVGADGVVHLRKTLAEGESASINGALPLSVVVGRANEITVQVRGKPFDLAAVAKDNVARFQVK